MNPRRLFTIVVCPSLLALLSAYEDTTTKTTLCNENASSTICVPAITSGDLLTGNQETPDPKNFQRLISSEFHIRYHHLLTNYPHFSVCFFVLLILQVASKISLDVQLMAVLVAFMIFESLKYVLLAAYLNTRQ